MNIAFLINNYPPAIGGAELYAAGLAERLVKKNNVSVITRAYKNAPSHEIQSNSNSGGYIHIERTSTTNIFGLRAIIHFIRALNIIRKNDIDVIHAYHVFSTGFVAVIIGRLLRIPVVIRDGQSLSSVENYLKNPIYRALVKYTLNRSIVYVDNPELQKIFGSLTKKDIRLLYNPVDTNRFKPKKYLGYDVALIGYVGRLEPFKGVDVLIRAFSKIDIYSKCFLAIIGEGSDKERLMEMSKDIGNIRFYGSIPYEEIHEVFNQFDIFVQPSLTPETPNTTLQAMASGLPIIATSCVASHILRHGENAIIMNPGIESDLGLAIIYIKSDEKIMETLGKNARKYALKNLSWKKHIDDVLEIYNGETWY